MQHIKNEGQYVGDKLQALVKTKELKQYTLAKEMGITFTHFSKKVGLKANFSQDQISKAAAFLGVTPEYLNNESRVFNQGDEIPPDAIAQPPAQPESNPLAAAANALAKAVESGVGNTPMNKAMQEMMDYLKRVDSKLDILLEEKVGNSDSD